MPIPVEKIIVRFEDKIRVVDKSMWENQTLEPSIVGDAGVLVNRGALVADIPSDVPFGTFCILVNFAAVKPEKG